MNFQELKSLVATVSRTFEGIYSERPKLVLGGCIIGAFVAYGFGKYIYLSKFCKSPPVYFYNFPVIGSFMTMILWPKEFRLNILPRYGDIVRYNIGTFRFYKINNADAAYKIYKIVTDRPEIVERIYTAVGLEPDLLVASHDRYWKQRRAMLMQSLSTLLSKSRVESNLVEIIENVTYEYLDNKISESGNSGEYLWYPRAATTNIAFNEVYSAMVNKYFKLDSEIFLRYNKRIREWFMYVMYVVISSLLPNFLKNVVLTEQVHLYKNAILDLRSMVEKDYDQHIASLNDINDNNDNDKNGGDMYTDEKSFTLKANKNKTNETEILTIGKYFCKEYDNFFCSDDIGKSKEFSKKLIIADLVDLMLGGTDTSSHSMEVGIALLAKNPDIQNVVYDELSEVYDTYDKDNNENFKFDLSKINQCHHLKAFVNELLRIGTNAPDAFPRFIKKDVRCIKFDDDHDDDNNAYDIICDYCDSKIWKSKEFINSLNNAYEKNNVVYDYILLKNTFIDLNIAYMHLNNKNSWNLESDPSKINLNYWLKPTTNSSKVVFVNNKNSIPFSSGKRDCPGQTLVKKTLYTFFANFLLKYQIVANSETNKVDIEYTWGELACTLKNEIPVIVKHRK